MTKLFEVPSLADEPYEDIPPAYAAFQALASAAGADFKEMAREWIVQAGGELESDKLKFGNYPTDGLVRGQNGALFVLLARGTPDDGPRAGLRRNDTVLKMGCRALMIARRTDLPILVVTSHLPDVDSRAGRILADLHTDIFDVAATVGDLAGFRRFRRHLTEAPAPAEPLPSVWRTEVFSQPELFDTGPPDA
ncbi:MAG TPA: hypothetical protein VFV09_10185 [Actinomycetota bacterium]|nr:hypothetical protein [Actinomycetota bacterium]